jgi:hypothetical protein
MDHPRHIQPSSLLSQQPPDDSTALSRARQPLSHAAGNSQQSKQALTSVGVHDNSKVIQLRVNMPNFTVLSQPSRKSLANTLELRRQRQLRYALNPIQKSPQYRAYRARQHRDGNADDQKWPDVLEDAFLNGKQFHLFDIQLLIIVKRSSTYPKWADGSSHIGASLTAGTSSSMNTYGSLMNKVYPLVNFPRKAWPAQGSRSLAIYKSSRHL